MKSVFFTLLFLLFAGYVAQGQENFKVIRVNGTIVLKNKGVSLETGTVFNEKEDLLFRSDDANAAVINPQRGRIIITSKNHNLAEAGSNSLPAMYNISKRGVLPGDPDELDMIFSGKYVVIGRDEVFIDKFVYPMDKEHFFFLRYVYKGEEINKKLSFSGDSLIIDKKELYTVDGKPIPSPDNTRIKLFYMNGANAQMVSEFNLIFPDTDQLAREVRIILDTYPDKTPAQKINEVNNYITEEYGKANRKVLQSWLEQTFNISPR